MANRYQICSRASVLVGGSPITGFNNESTEEIVAEQLYDSVLNNLLASYRWRFASQYVELSRDEELPGAKWDAQYSLPAGTTILYGIYLDEEPFDFDRVGNKIHCNVRGDDVIVALVGFVPDEELFPPYFTAVLELKLAAMFAVPIAEDPQKANVYEGMAMRQFVQARSIESQGRTAVKISVGGLAAYHGGRA
jgi:hypothetical protein